MHQIYELLTAKELTLVADVLGGIVDNDLYFKQFTKTKKLQSIFYVVVLLDLAFVASDGRILLTSTGEKLLQELTLSLI